jgi:thiol-disulfide isomerase/thioredoxin
MSGNLFSIGRDKFSLHGSASDKVLKINLKGIIFVLFKSEGCGGCREFKPIYYDVARSLESEPVGFGVVDVGSEEGKSIIAMSRTSNTKISTIPHVFIYIDGEPMGSVTTKRSPDGWRTAVQTSVSKAIAMKRAGSSHSPAAPPPPPPAMHSGAAASGAGGAGYSTGSEGPTPGYGLVGAPSSGPRFMTPRTSSTQVPPGGGRFEIPAIGDGSVSAGDGKYSKLTKGGYEHVFSKPEGKTYNAPWESSYGMS